MNTLHNKAIALKYKGLTYREISEKLKGKLSENTLKEYFSTEGMLYVPYLEYEINQNQWSEREVRNEYKKMAAYTAKITKEILKQSLIRHDFRLALSVIKYIEDMAGIGVQSNKAKEERGRFETYEDFFAECKRLGIDPKTGYRLSETPIVNKN